MKKPIYAIAIQNCETKTESSSEFKMAVGSLNFSRQNSIKIISVDLHKPNENQYQHPDSFITSKQTRQFDFEFFHEYPPTKLIWSPQNVNFNILASASDSIKLWHIKDNNSEDLIWDSSFLKAKSVQEGFLEPPVVTSFDWNRHSPNLIVGAGIEKICTIWDFEQ